MADDDKNKDLIEDFLGQMSTYIKNTVEELKGGSSGDAGNGPATPPAKETVTPPADPPKEKKKHFWFGEIED